MQLRHVVLFLATVLVGSGASADVVRVGDLNTRQIRALDRNKTVVFLQGGMLEEHGPWYGPCSPVASSDQRQRPVKAFEQP